MRSPNIAEWSTFNESFSKGVVPGIWKEDTILPLKMQANR